MAKRLFDLVCSLVGLVLLSPLFLLIAVWIKLDSPGPVLYRGVRTGRFGKPFRMLKFRTLVIDAEQRGGPSTGYNDPRQTRAGRFLRRYKLDELPQLMNVMKGEMSVVGPRPEVPQYTALYDDEEKIILSVRPGITDYASIEFINLSRVLGSEDVDRTYEEQVRPIKNRLRVKYAKEQGFWVDLKIISLTLYRMIRARDGLR